MRAIVYLVAALSLGGCRHEQARDAAVAEQAPQHPRRDVLSGIPAMEHARLNDTTGTPDAQHREYGTLFSSDSVRNYYRTMLRVAGYQIQSDQGTAQLATIYATNDSNAVWVRVWQDPPGVRFALIGSALGKPPVADTTRPHVAPAPPKPSQP